MSLNPDPGRKVAPLPYILMPLIHGLLRYENLANDLQKFARKEISLTANINRLEPMTFFPDLCSFVQVKSRTFKAG